MTENLYEQISTAESMLRESEKALAAMRQVHSLIGEVVGRGESAGGHVVAECTAGAGLSDLRLDPRVMRMASEDLAVAIQDAVGAATIDLREKTQEAIAAAGLRTGVSYSPEDARQRVAEMRERLMSTSRTAADGLARAQHQLDRSQRD